MRWFFPAWNGDFRLESVDSGQCKLIVISPTEAEKTTLNKFLASALEQSWINEPITVTDTVTIEGIRASVGKAGKLLAKLARPSKSTLTAISYDAPKDAKKKGDSKKDDKATSDFKKPSGKTKKEAVVEVVDGTGEELDKKIDKAEKRGAKAAVSVRRPTPSCPTCVPGAIGPATEVLLAFLSPRQHEEWAKHRSISVIGGTTGHRYVISHRHSKLAQAQGRITWDADDKGVIHFHDSSVPPEEEVLAAKLILEHREEWLRNEATTLDHDFTNVLKNPFGDLMDGVEDARLMSSIGGALLGALSVRQGMKENDA